MSFQHSSWVEGRRSSSSGLSEQALESLLRYPLCIELEATLAELSRLPIEDVELASERFREDLRTQAARVERAIELFDPHALAIVQGYDPSNAVAREIAIRRDLSVIAFENTAHKERMLWDDQSALTTNRNLAKNYFWRYRDSVAQEQAEAYCKSLIAQTKANKTAEHESPVRAFEGSAAGRPNVLFLGQVYTDSSIIFGVGAWKTPVDLAVALARLAVELDFNLWFKLHPKEVSGFAPVTGRPYRKLTHRKLMANAEFRELSKDTSRFMVDHENAYDTYGLIGAAEVAVTVNSQAGLEAAIRGLPTVVAGDAFYGGLGFTQDAPEPRLLKVQLEHALGLDEEQKREATAEARVLAYIYFERYCIQKSPESVANVIARRCFARG